MITGGLEPPTLDLLGLRANQLRQATVILDVFGSFPRI